ncbi:hypothetical protein C0991_012109 [Blastosporella zonata]|nr:hypothetical protein C0991_012109 [Blastosporella zonata]
MPPKKAKKISLNEFLGDNALGSWADEMDLLPNAPAARNDDDQGARPGGYGRRDDFPSTRLDRAGPPREDIPLPTRPPYTAFIGNLAFDLKESELEEFFAPTKTKSVKIIKDREEKPKGFGYIEFEELDGLKDALQKSGSERSAFGGSGGGGFEDDSKFEGPWRRDGPLPDQSRDFPRRRFDGPPPDRERLPSVAEGAWRSTRVSGPDELPPPRRRSGFSTPDGQPSPADQADWARGSKFVPAAAPSEERYGSIRGPRSDMGPPKEFSADEGSWRRSKSSISRNSTPPTPQLNRRKLELLPRSGTPSAAQSPLSSPKMSATPAVAPSSARASPFGAARPVDVTGKEQEVTERLEKERDFTKERITMSRTNSRQASERAPLTGTGTPPTSAGVSAAGSSIASASPKIAPKSLAPSVRPTLSFANAAAAKKEAAAKEERSDEVEQVTEKVAEVEV